MRRWSPVLGVAILALALGSSVLTRSTEASMRAPGEPPQLLQVRAKYIDLSGNRDETKTTLFLVNNSASRTVNLGDLLALGPGGIDEVMATHGGLNGVALAPLSTIELPIDSVTFPGLRPELEIGERGVATILVQWWGAKEALQLTSSIHLEQPGNINNRVISVFEGRVLAK